MTYQTSRTLRRATILLAGGLALAGCESDSKPQPPVGHDFFPAADGRALHNIMDVQYRNGARNDGMLQAYHFDGEVLNSLGQEKLKLMIPDDSHTTTTIYMNVPENDDMDLRRQNVVAYLQTRGVEESQLKFVNGPNPATLTPAAPGLARLPRTENINSPLNGGDADYSGLSGSTGASASGNP